MRMEYSQIMKLQHNTGIYLKSYNQLFPCLRYFWPYNKLCFSMYSTARKFNPLSLNFLVGVVFGISITSLLILNNLSNLFKTRVDQEKAMQATNELVRAKFQAARKNAITIIKI